MAGRSGYGKKIDTWEWSRPGVSKIPVYVYMSGTSFRAVNISLGINEGGNDLKQLQARVFAQLTDRYKIEWSPYLRIGFEGKYTTHRLREDGNGYDGEYVDASELMEREHMPNREVQMELEIQDYELGTYVSGEKCHRRTNSSQISPAGPEKRRAGGTTRRTL